jgi:cytochrome b6-f complex iron-sulfur subunit
MPEPVKAFKLDRRTVLTILGGTAATAYGAALLYPIYRYLKSGAENLLDANPISEVNLGPEADVKPGTGKLFLFGSKPALLIRRTDGTLVSFMATCTHLGCTVKYAESQDRITCACHGGVYDATTGKNISGPPPRPLPALKVSVDQGRIVVRV